MNNRICYIELESRWFNVVLMNGYAPTEEKEEETNDIFYKDLDNVYDLIPNNKMKIFLGDLNAKLEQKIIYRPIIRKECLFRVSNVKKYH